MPQLPKEHYSDELHERALRTMFGLTARKRRPGPESGLAAKYSRQGMFADLYAWDESKHPRGKSGQWSESESGESQEEKKSSRQGLPSANSVSEHDDAQNRAAAGGFKGFFLSEGTGEPDSVFFLGKTMGLRGGRDISSGKEGETITLYRGSSTTSPAKGHYYTTDREWSRQFTQSGRDEEIRSITVNLSDLMDDSKADDPGDDRIGYAKPWDESKHPRGKDGRWGSGGGKHPGTKSDTKIKRGDVVLTAPAGSRPGFHGERVIDVDTAAGKVEVDASIAEHVQAINDAGIVTGQSNSGMRADYLGTKAEGRWLGSGYLAFFQSDLEASEIERIKAAADASGMHFYEHPLFGEPGVSVRLVDIYRDDVITDADSRDRWQTFTDHLLEPAGPLEVIHRKRRWSRRHSGEG